MASRKILLKNMMYPELEQYLIQMGEKKYRASQIFRKLYEGAASFQDLTELPARLREQLAENAEIHAVSMLRRQISKDGTRKYLFSVQGGDAVESVYMRYHYGSSVCVSSQAGCRMGCAFCASGIDGLSRGLTAGEIVDQVVAASRDTGERIGHVVIMGTGEPFDNYDELLRAIHLMNDSRGLGIGHRNITVSTCGLIPYIKRFARDLPQTGLAVSLHAPEQKLRNTLMPVAAAYPLPDLMDACREYTRLTRRRITFEYALIDGVNDRPEHGDALAKLLKGMLCHVNLIPLNHVEEKTFHSSSNRTAEQFQHTLQQHGIPVTVRRQLGADISAACGQLRRGEGGSKKEKN